MATHILDFQLQLMLSSIARALILLSVLNAAFLNPIELYLEGKVFQEVRCAVCLVGFRSRPSINPYTDCRRLSPWRMLRGNLLEVS